ncbi:MAG: urea transporter, permease protein UrtC [Firmicutes bacterium]|nr:urea transporter, permease protein UrtC [Bacillota bacterium]
MKVRTKRDIIFVGISVLIYLVGEVLILTGAIPPYLERSIVTVCINIILAASLNLINGITGQFSIGHAGFMAVGAYVSAILTVKFGISFVVAIIAGAAASALLGVLIGLPTLRLSGDYLAIATLGLGEIIRIVILNISYVGGASGLVGIPKDTTFTWAFALMVFSLLFIRNFVESSHGRACIAIRENEIAAEAMGINTTKYKVLAFALGAGFAGVAGALFVHYNYMAHPGSFTFLRSFDILTMVVFGGLGSMTGAVTGAVVLTLLTFFLADIPELRMVIYSVLLIILMLYRPQGLFGNKELSLKMLTRLIGGGRRDAAEGK